MPEPDLKLDEAIASQDPWDAAASAERPTRLLRFAERDFKLIAPESIKQINALFLSPSKLESLASHYKSQLGFEVTTDTLAAARIVRLCAEDHPPIEKLLALADKQPGFFNSLYIASTDLCGLQNVQAAIDEAQGNDELDQL